jgi:LuxR family transcriptional regulator, maltose regulon positive regulatory protein
MAIETIQRPPRARSHIIERPRITRLLDETKARTIMLVAPAGFGKTTLARQWLDPRPHGWYRGSPASSDVAALAAGVAKAASAIVPGAGKRMMERLGIVGAPPPKADVLAAMLGEDLADWPDEAWVAVDDYHFAMESVPSETFVEELILRSPVRFLVTSRTRPTWATARRMLYGEILEVGRSALALTHDEAKEVLVDRKAEEVAGLMALTEGWPAVIGLASLSSEPVVSEAEMPDTLYEYCAEELFQKFPREFRTALCTIALAPSISLELLRELFGEKAARIAHAAEEGGFVTRSKSGDFDMHPLLRTFLLAKLDEESPERTGRVIRDLAGHLVRARQWDDALAVAGRSNDLALIECLIDSALDELLAQGRLETLNEWLQRARALGESPIFDLTDAEVAFRQGDHAHALLQATNSASQLQDGHHRVSRAWFRAGQSAYFLDRAAEACTLCERARTTASNPRDEKDALWGLFNARVDLESGRPQSLLKEIEMRRPLSLDDEIRLATGGLFLSTRWGSLDAALGRARGVANRIHEAEPITETGFLQSYSHVLILTARYEEALTAVEQELARAREFSMDFVIPHALLMGAAAAMGLRHFGDSRDRLDAAASTEDRYVTVLADMFRARIHLYQGEPSEALALLPPPLGGDLNASFEAELVAHRALALAALRRFDEALLACEDALRLSESIEPTVLVKGAQAIVAVRQRNPCAGEMGRAAYTSARTFGCFDSFVCAYRTCPEILDSLQAPPRLTRDLWPVLTRARDIGLARRVGIRPKPSESGSGRLTKREKEVLHLVAQGLTNAEIARKLFLAEVTVKVHVRHILRKLGVRSRTEAAVRAALLDDPESGG